MVLLGTIVRLFRRSGRTARQDRCDLGHRCAIHYPKTWIFLVLSGVMARLQVVLHAAGEGFRFAEATVKMVRPL